MGRESFTQESPSPRDAGNMETRPRPCGTRPRGTLNILGVSASGAVFLSAHDYSDRYKTGINIAQPLLETIQTIGPYNVIQVITDNVANCKVAGAIIEDKYPNIFWSRCLVHTLNLLMHDIVKMKGP